MGLRAFFRRKRQPITTTVAPQQRKCRRHRADIPYTLPKDKQEEARINFQHHLFYQLLKGHYIVPLDRQQTREILDVGSGTGKWIGDMAKLFPHARCIGLNVEPPFSTLPPTYSFLQGNVLEGLPLNDRCMDFTHQRLMVGAIPTVTWPFVVQELVRVTRPKGWVELVEGGNTYLNVGPQTEQFIEWGKVASKQVGIDAALMSRLEHLLVAAGLRQVKKRVLCVPVGKWGGRQGELVAKDMHAGLLGLKDFYLRALALSAEQFDETVATLPQEWEKYGTSYEFYIAYGQRGA